MKNREYKRTLAMVIMSAVIAGEIFAAPLSVKAADTTVKTQAEAVDDSKANVEKEETVFIKTDGSGAGVMMTVTDKLKNIGDIASVKDLSELKDIVNVKGDEEFSRDGSALTWDADGSDIVYKGTTDKETPVSISVSYELDGKKLQASELVGKSGHLKIRYDYTNTSAKSGAYVPFMMGTGLLLDGSHFTNIKVSSGRILSDGDRSVVIGVAIPGLAASLNIDSDKLGIPEYFEVETDVTDYESITGMTIATNEVFSKLDADKLDDVDDLIDAVDRIQDAADQLTDGSGQLMEGLDTLLASSGTLVDGIDQLASGSEELKSGADSLANGAGVLSDNLGVASLKVSGVLLPGVRSLDAGVAQLGASLQSESVQKLTGGVKNLSDYTAQAAAGAAKLSAGIGQIADGTAALSAKLPALAQGVSSLNSGVQQIAQGTTALNQTVSAAADASSEAASTTAELAGLAAGLGSTATVQVPEVSETATVVTSTETASAEIDGTQAILDAIVSAENAGTIDAETAAAVKIAVENLTANYEKVNYESKTITAGGGTAQVEVPGVAAVQQKALAAANAAGTVNALLNTGVAEMQIPSIKSLAEQLYGGVNVGSETSPSLASGAAALEAVVNRGDAESQTPSLVNAFESLNAALNNGDPTTQTASIKAGASALSDNLSMISAGAANIDAGVNGEGGLVESLGAGAIGLKDGTGKLLAGIDGEDGLASGLEKLSAGAVSLADGTLSLDGGAARLAAGIGTLKTGSDELVAGVTKLDDGAKSLNEGMVQFNEEAIKKLSDAANEDVKGLVERVDKVLAASREYKSFSGISEGMEGTVKFIFVTEAK